MIPISAATVPRRRIAEILLLVFAFSAWNLTGPAHIALFALVILFLVDWPVAGPRLRRDPAFWLGLAAVILVTLLAVRAALLFPETAERQWPAIWEWASPFLFVVFAWWLRGDVRLIRLVLLAALIGLVVGVLRKSDWALLGEALGGMRYHFGQPALGIAFIASVALLGLALYRPPLVSAGSGQAVRTLVIAAAWGLAVAFVVAMLLILQARGAAVGLLAAGGTLVAYRLWQARGAKRERRSGLVPAAMILVLLVAVATAAIWSGRDRLVQDLAALGPGGDPEALAWTSSTAIRINLWRTGLEVFAARPGLGWGPGTDTTKYLIPNEAVALPAATLEHAPGAAHLHSVIVEALVRFGSTALLIAVPLAILLVRSGWVMWRRLATEDPRLREWLVLVALMTGLFLIYEYRLVHVDMRFFLLLFLGIWYSFSLRPDSDPA
ncbi:O-antigen ligase family protein [Thioalkalicoccus limnaeus]|uniref:O-antigen ligase family protein n=1 Tax=Thioalkalicoccus limnaeus TaxID=120681 RepID=A0ABV4B956_9GAMM